MTIVNKSINNKCWWGYGESRTLMHHWWECRLVQPLWKVVWRYLKKLKMEQPFDRAIQLLGMHPKKPETLIWKNMCSPMFIAALITIVNIWKQPKCPSVDEWINKLWYIYTMEYCSAVKRGGHLNFCNSMDEPGEYYAKWNKLVRERQTPYNFTYMWKLMNKIN